MDSKVAKERLERLREYRQWQPRDLSLAREVTAFASRAKKVDRTLSKLLEVWETVLPRELGESCRPVGIKAGSLDLACSSSAARYEFTRWLQEGGKQALSKAGQNVLRVRFMGASFPVVSEVRERAVIKASASVEKKPGRKPRQ